MLKPQANKQNNNTLFLCEFLASSFPTQPGPVPLPAFMSYVVGSDLLDL